MRWVTYLSPSGGGERPGVIDDGCVFGYPGGETVPGLLAAGPAALADARQRALASPVEIIVEFETRLCAPLRPSGPVPALVDGAWTALDPALVRGTDDGTALPAGTTAATATVGVVAVFGAGRHAGYAPACLWRTPERAPVALTVGPAIVTPEEFGGERLTVTASVDDAPLATAEIGGGADWAPEPHGDAAALLPAETRLLEPGEELHIDAGGLGEFELRVGSGA
ncbi:hypothetical protein [Nocardiopsis trehalosi]|jgi:hypothetical protein|uniref:hypothetical protein n=1 Tax=Nocardiopsis trehalosi TaxID=109329 RepID=UPI00082C1502|nr:hypothetical protein [Nocardiopsis trehalosi]